MLESRQQAAPVLLVEDNEDDIVLLERAARKVALACPLQTVRDGDAAVAYLSGSGEYADRTRYPLPRLVLLDLKLPRRSGFEVLVWLRAQPLLRRLPVVVLTTSAQADDVARAYTLGANSYLVKPALYGDLHALLAVVDRYWFGLASLPNLLDNEDEQ